jgi:hypothetical protein
VTGKCLLYGYSQINYKGNQSEVLEKWTRKCNELWQIAVKFYRLVTLCLAAFHTFDLTIFAWHSTLLLGVHDWSFPFVHTGTPLLPAVHCTDIMAVPLNVRKYGTLYRGFL